MTISVYPGKQVLSDREGNVYGSVKSGEQVAFEVADIAAEGELRKAVKYLEALCRYMEEVVGDNLTEDN